MEEEGWLGITWTVAVSMKNGPCWNDGEDFAVNVREVEEEEPN